MRGPVDFFYILILSRWSNGVNGYSENFAKKYRGR